MSLYINFTSQLHDCVIRAFFLPIILEKNGGFEAKLVSISPYPKLYSEMITLESSCCVKVPITCHVSFTLRGANQAEGASGGAERKQKQRKERSPFERR